MPRYTVMQATGVGHPCRTRRSIARRTGLAVFALVLDAACRPPTASQPPDRGGTLPAMLVGLNDVAIDASGRPFATDSASGQLYTVSDARRELVPVFEAPPYLRPNGLAFDDRGAVLFVADTTGVHRVDLGAHTTTRLAQPRGASLGIFDGLYFVRAPTGPRLVAIQALSGSGRVVSAALTEALDAVTRLDVLESAHPLFDAPTTGAVVGSSIYVIANSQLWFPRAPQPTIVVRTPIW
jgi:hypothetical protein